MEQKPNAKPTQQHSIQQHHNPNPNPNLADRGNCPYGNIAPSKLCEMPGLQQQAEHFATGILKRKLDVF